MGLKTWSINYSQGIFSIKRMNNVLGRVTTEELKFLAYFHCREYILGGVPYFLDSIYSNPIYFDPTFFDITEFFKQ